MIVGKSTELPRILPVIHPNAGSEVIYRRRLNKLIREMHDSVKYWIEAAYKANEPIIAQDELPASVLKRVVRKLSRRWQRRFDEIAPKLAEYFAQSANQRTAGSLEKILRDGGMSVKFTMTRAARDVMKATINEQVGLIRSIPQRYFTEIEGLVMRSVTAGRDLAPLSRALHEQYGVTKRRAAFIARDQNNKATASIMRVRQIELGVEEAVWIHSHGGKVPRPTHLANDGKRYDIRKGWLDPAVNERIWPGTLPNCRCVSRSVVSGFS